MVENREGDISTPSIVAGGNSPEPESEPTLIPESSMLNCPVCSISYPQENRGVATPDLHIITVL